MNVICLARERQARRGSASKPASNAASKAASKAACAPAQEGFDDDGYLAQHELLLSRVKARLAEMDGRRLSLVVAAVLRECFAFIGDDAQRAHVMLVDGPRRQLDGAPPSVDDAPLAPRRTTLTDPRLSSALRALLHSRGYRMDDAQFDALFGLARRAALLWSEQGCVTPIDELVRLHVYAWRCIRQEGRLIRGASMGRGPRLITV